MSEPSDELVVLVARALFESIWNKPFTSKPRSWDAEKNDPQVFDNYQRQAIDVLVAAHDAGFIVYRDELEQVGWRMPVEHEPIPVEQLERSRPEGWMPTYVVRR